MQAQESLAALQRGEDAGGKLGPWGEAESRDEAGGSGGELERTLGQHTHQHVILHPAFVYEQFSVYLIAALAPGGPHSRRGLVTWQGRAEAKISLWSDEEPVCACCKPNKLLPFPLCHISDSWARRQRPQTCVKSQCLGKREQHLAAEAWSSSTGQGDFDIQGWPMECEGLASSGLGVREGRSEGQEGVYCVCRGKAG